MRKSIHCVALIAALLLHGCNGGIESDLEKSGDELRKEAAGMSEAELEKKIDEIEKYMESLGKKYGDKEPTGEDMKKATKAIEAAGIYATALAQKKMK